MSDLQEIVDFFDHLEAAVWSLEMQTQTNRLTISAGICNLLGTSREEFYRNRSIWKEKIYPEDIGILQDHIENLYNGRSNAVEIRFIDQSGETRWVESKGTAVLDDENHVVRLNGLIHDITQNKAALEELECKCLMLQKTLNTIDVGTWSFSDEVRKIEYTSDALHKITGYLPGRFQDRNSWRDIIHPDDVRIFENLSVNVRRGIPDFSEYRIIHASGEIRWVQVRIIPTLNSSGSLTRLDGAVIDITSRKMMEEALQRSEQRYKSLFEYNTDLIFEVDLDSHILAINGVAKETLGDKIFELDIDHYLVETFGVDSLKLMAEYYEKAKRGEPQSYEMTARQKDGRVTHWEMKKVPIYVNNETVGVFAICKDITSKRETENALAESEAMYRLIADNMTDLVGIVHLDGSIRYASPSHKKVLGYDDECMMGSSVFDYVDPENVEFIKKEFQQLVRSGMNKSQHFSILHAGGYPVYVDCMGTPVLGEDGAVEYIILVSRDITEKLRIELELQDSEERYRRLIELSPQPIASHFDGKFNYINEAGIRLLGANDANELIGKQILDIIHPDYWKAADKRVRSVVEKKYNQSMEYRILRLDGQIIEAEVTGIYDPKTQSILTVFNDITERKKAERELKKSEERYRRLVELSPVAIAVMREDQLMYVNPAGMRVVDAKKPEDIIGTSPLDWVHPSDRELAKERIDSIQFNDYYAAEEFKLNRLDGKTVDVTATAIYDSQSMSTQIVFEDITARKQAERALSESEELNRQLVELSPEAIVLHSDFKFTYVNPVGLRLFGTSQLSELIGQSIFDVIHPDYKKRAALRLAGIYAELSTTPLIEQKIVQFDGTVIDVEVIGTTIPYMGKNAGLTLFHDITERKKVDLERTRAEQAIRESEDRYLKLHTSLDRFSHDLFGVMKVFEMERRLIKEVREVMNATNVGLVELDRNHDVLIKSGNHSIPKKLLGKIVAYRERLPISEIIDTEYGYFLKIGEFRGKSSLLCIGEKPPSLQITAQRVWLKTITRYVSVLYDNFESIEDLSRELEQMASHQIAPSWLLRLLFNLSENERKRLSQDLHDAALQEQIIWYRKLDQLTTDDSVPLELQEQLQQITQGLLDVIYQIRITCNELMPPMLKEEGLVSSLEALFEFTQLRSNYSIEFEADDFRHSLSNDLLIGLYRIVQELLANATKHSKATGIHIHLSSQPDRIELNYKDNGVGMDIRGVKDLFHSMGVYGMKERVRSMDGKMDFYSWPNKGLSVFISVPARLTTP